MKERPLICQSESVIGILEGRKTQTRRVVKERVSISDHGMGHNPMVLHKGDWYRPVEWSPYGQPGDRLWVRETFVLERDDLEVDEPIIPTDRPHFHHTGGENEFDSEYYLFPHYRANDPAPDLMYEDMDEPGCKWQPSIFMPRWASRITLEIVNIRVERVQDISEEDAISEGVNPYDHIKKEIVSRDNEIIFSNAYQASYQLLWNSINAKRGYGWESNPWVWVIEFKKVDGLCL
jgi:hypothetical protein